jgi:hypothetical protein
MPPLAAFDLVVLLCADGVASGMDGFEGTEEKAISWVSTYVVKAGDIQMHRPLVPSFAMVERSPPSGKASDIVVGFSCGTTKWPCGSCRSDNAHMYLEAFV